MGAMRGMVEETSRHDRAFWRAAYQEHGSIVLAYLVRRTGRREDAEDLLQETFMRAMDAGTFTEGNLRGYLLRTAHNLDVNRHRRLRLVEREATSEGPSPAASATPAFRSPEKHAEWKGFTERLDGVLSGMPVRQRAAFELGVLRQRPYAEVARECGCSLNTVKVNVWRARQEIIEKLGDDLNDLKGMLS